MRGRRRVVASMMAALLGAALLIGCQVHLFGPAEKAGAPAEALPTPTATFAGYSSPDRQQLAPSNAKPAGFTSPPSGSGVSRYLRQRLNWRSCGEFDCATLKAPLDWHDPDGQAITLAVKRAKATAQPRLGSLFVNPGGPGGSAQDYLSSLDRQGLEGYDVIGMDPRGSGASTPVVCGDGPQTDAYLNVDSSPDTQAERDALMAATKEFARQCHQNSGALLDHISSIDTIYDFDMLRQILGDAKFNYLGVSYGTWLGALYADLYPTNVGRMVLDSPVNITDNQSVIQADGFELNLHSYAQWCAEQHCFLGGTPQEVIMSLQSFFAQLDKTPLQVANRQLTQSLAVSGLIVFFYSGSDGYSTLTNFLQQAIEQGNGERLLAAADLMNERNSDGSYGQLMYSFPAIQCADAGDKGVQDAWNQWALDSKSAPVMGPLLGPNLICPLWVAPPAPQVNISAKDAPPLLIVSNVGDSATPHQFAEWMQQRIAGSVLVSRQASGHGAYESGSHCLDTTVRSFLASGSLPVNGTVCSDG